MEVIGLNGYSRASGLQRQPTFNVGYSGTINRRDQEEAQKALDDIKVSKDSKDIAELNSFLDGFGELGKFLKGLSNNIEQSEPLIEKNNELLRPAQRKALDAEIEASANESRRILRSNDSPLQRVRSVLAQIKEAVTQKGMSGEAIAEEFAEYKTLLGEKFFDLLKKGSFQAINLLSSGLDTLHTASLDISMSNIDFLKTVKQVTTDIISALKNQSGLKDGESYNPFDKLSTLPTKQAEIVSQNFAGKQLSIWA